MRLDQEDASEKQSGSTSVEKQLFKVITLVATDKQEIYVAKNKAGTMTRLIQEYPLAKVTKMDIHGLKLQSKLMYPHILHVQKVGPVRLANNVLGVRVTYEYPEGGTLFDLLVQKKQFSEQQAQWFFQQLALAVDFCHRRDVAVCDLKLTNILVNRKKGVIKLTNFQLAEDLLCLEGRNKQTRKVTLQYMAPELSSFHQQDTPEVIKSGDVWCMGVILYAMLCGRYPFDSSRAKQQTKDKKVKQRIMEGAYNRQALSNVSPDVLELLDGMFKVDPTARLTLSDIMSHRWVLQGTPPSYQSFNTVYNLDVERAYLARRNLDQIDGLARKLSELQQAVYYNYGSASKKLPRTDEVMEEGDAAAVI